MTDQRVVPGADGSRFASIVHVVETGSTNADLLQAARGGEPAGAVLVTDHQTAGRGRQSRAWHDDPGNAMLMSVLLRPPRPVVPIVPLLAGLAVTDGATAVVEAADGSDGSASLALKWPNDVLVPALAERKLSGILAEAVTAPSLAVVVGMGLNLRWGTQPPADVAARAATLEEVAGRPVDRWDVARAVLAALDRWLVTAEGDGGHDSVLEEYRRRCCTIGRAVRLERPADVIEGTAVSVADDGALVVETSDGLVSVTAGDAHHLA